MKTMDARAWVEHADERLSAAGYRRGAARRSVIGLLARRGCALSAHEIEERLREGGERAVSRASVYRVLEQLEEIDLVARVELGDGLSRYELVDPAGHHHHHLLCDSCGKLIPFSDAGLERVIGRVGRDHAFVVGEHDVTLHGTCEACRARAARARRARRGRARA
jgi:Fur family ferric uptake transcriptional regulator